MVREPGGVERGQHRLEKSLTEDPTSSPLKEAGCFFPPDPWKKNCLMMPSEMTPGSRTGEAHGMLPQVLQFETHTIFSQLQGGKGGFRRAHFDNPRYGFVPLFSFYPLTNFTTVQDGEYPMMFKHP